MESHLSGRALFVGLAVVVCFAGCTTAGETPKSEFQSMHQYTSGDPTNKGYKYLEASQFIEFCVELDSQDDRLPDPDHPSHDPTSPNYQPQVNPDLWNPEPLYDSRKEVAHDVVEFLNTGEKETDVNKGWIKLYRDILARVRDSKNPPKVVNEEMLFKDPRYNGFGPYQTAWVLYEGRNENAGAYAIAIRGTVFSAEPSVVEDVLFHPVRAQDFLSSSVSFATFPGAALHSGFTHATFSLLLDDRYGVLRVLHSNVLDKKTKPIPSNIRLYIVGHSQGASMATLTHAFFHYAMKDATATSDVFDVYGKNYKLKSYVFAQPKLGNFAFAADFAYITQGLDNALVINNDIDLVPQVPLTLQDVEDLDGDLPGTSWKGKVLHRIGGIGSGLRGLISRIAEYFVRIEAAGYGYYYGYPRFTFETKDQVASSWNFMAAGHVLLVHGTPGDPADEFLQHHAWTYRNLIKGQLQ